jgi:predicted transcriptional regulator
MTVKEKLHARIDQMSDSEAEALLRIAERRTRDPLTRLWDEAPADDEPWTDADEAAVAEGDADISAGDVVDFDELRRDLAS